MAQNSPKLDRIWFGWVQWYIGTTMNNELTLAGKEMNENRVRSAIAVLRWVLGLVIFAESAQFLFSASAAHAFAKSGMPNIIRLALGWSEMAAAFLLLIPRLEKIGGRSLVFILGLAIVVHLLHGWFDVGGLMVYVAATWAVMEASPRAGGSIGGS